MDDQRYRNQSSRPEHKVWRAMRNRCRNPKNPDYPTHGGRGIKVCERWNSFAEFLSDLGPRPDPGCRLRRKDLTGDYTPENCRWTTAEDYAVTRSDSDLNTFVLRCKMLADKLGGSPNYMELMALFHSKAKATDFAQSPGQLLREWEEGQDDCS